MGERNYTFKNNTEGIDKFSFSKLSTYKHCPYGYYLTYIKHIKGKDSIYGTLGTYAHESSQDIVEGKINNDEAIDNFLSGLDEAENILDLRFPTDNTRTNYIECIEHFLENYKPQYDKYSIEQGFDTLIGETKTLVYGFIDLIIYNKDGSIDIVDYKTSSNFTKQDFINKKMQLLIYAKALLKEGFKINRLYFNMLKYCTIEWNEINNKKEIVSKSTKCERNKIGDKLKSVAKRLLKKEGLLEDEIDDKIQQMIETNEIDDLIKDRFTIKDFEVDVELNEESMMEMENWVDDIVNNINKCGKNEDLYECVKLDKGSEFFCNMLCNKPCKYFEEYKNNNNNSYKNRKKKQQEETEEDEELL